MSHIVISRKVSRKTVDLDLRFWSKAALTANPERCWHWQKGKQNKGYGVFGIGRKAFLAHRVAYLIGHGRDPGKFCVCHKCDNPSCVNPKHLFLGTTIQNLKDMTKKGRRVHGEGYSNAKLTDELVRKCRQRSASGESGRSIARSLDISVATIAMMLKGETWTHVK